MTKTRCETGLDGHSRESVVALSPERVERTKAAFSTRRVPPEACATLVSGALRPRSGDLVIAPVEALGQHKRLEHPNGRKVRLFVGDEVIVCYGSRYATDQFEAVVPQDLGPCDLVAGGGIAAIAVSKHASMRDATRLRPSGLVGDAAGRRINVGDWAIPHPLIDSLDDSRRPPTYAVVGASMNAGKTTTAAKLIRGMARAGLLVGAAKVTGTGSGGDLWHMADAGAAEAIDFTDAGLASTFLASPARIESVLTTLVCHLAAKKMDAIVLEIADGILQSETAALVSSKRFAGTVDQVIFAASDPVSAATGVDWLRRRELPIVAISGAITRSSLAMREATAATGLPVLDGEALALLGPHVPDSGVTRPPSPTIARISRQACAS